MNVIEKTKKCVGCGACVDVCSEHTLHLTKNADGFYIAAYHSDTCIQCGACTEVCPALHVGTGAAPMQFYYGWSYDEDLRSRSSSGGLVSELTKLVLQNGGVVFGARYAEDHKSVPMASTLECSPDDLRRSKYCQSFADGMYAKASACLQAGKQVMIVGTPCQISAARRMFGAHENLLLVDFLCGGVTPETAFADYISHMERKYRSKVKSVNMRDKAFGWTKPRIRIVFENGKEYSAHNRLDLYFHYFYTVYMKNTPCITCPFVKHADADLTVGDFWGYRAAHVPMEEKGISFLAVNTEKGSSFLPDLQAKMLLSPMDASYAAYAYQEKSHTKENLSRREIFLKDMRQTSFWDAAKKHDFRYGTWGILAADLLRKVKRKVVRK